jgi:hypothetical protein
VNTGGRRRPLGPATRGLSACALVLAVLGLWLGTANGRSQLDRQMVTAVSHTVSVSHIVAKPPLPGADALPVTAVLLTVALGILLIGVRRTIAPVLQRSETRRGRAPPGGPGQF